jgi:pSer/pThr/pTyr-binding forkhead associated (FHA) protein
MYKLHIRDDSGQTTVVPVTRERVTVGRQEGNTIRLTERNVSRTHARIVVKDSQILIEDVSRYGTRINGLRIKKRKAIAANDVIQIGDYNLQVEFEVQSMSDTEPHVPAVNKAEKKETKEKEKHRQDAPTRVEPAVSGVDSTSMINLNDIQQAAKNKSVEKSRVVADLPTLVAVNTALAGQEFRLSGKKVVIGRTDDNDVVVDHRSISRNHAQVTNEGGRITIQDLESANGMKINGEFYKQSVLRRGDMVELGHVTLRYLEPGETFTYNPDDYADIDSGSGDGQKSGSNKVWAILVVLIVVAAGVGIAIKFGGGTDPSTISNIDNPTRSKPDTKVAKADTKTTKRKTLPTEAMKKDVSVTKTETSSGKATSATVKDAVQPGTPRSNKATLAALQAQAQTQLNKKAWNEALAICQKMSALDASNIFASGCIQKSREYTGLKQTYETALRLAKSRSWEQAWTTLSKIANVDEKSDTGKKFSRLKDAVAKAYAGKLVKKAKRALKRKSYKSAIDLADQALDLNPKADEAQFVRTKAAKAKAKRDKKLAAKKKDPLKGKPPKSADKKKDKTKTTQPKEPKSAGTASLNSWNDYIRAAFSAGGSKKVKLLKQAAKKGFKQAYYYLGRAFKGSSCKTARSYFKKYLAWGGRNLNKAKTAKIYLAQLGDCSK